MYRPVKQALLLSSAPTSAQSHTAVIDTLGYDRVALGVAFSSVSSTNPEITVKVGEGDTTSSFTDIVELTGGAAITTAVGWVIPNAPTNTSVADTIHMDIDTRTRKRYLLLTVTPFTTKTVTSFATFMNPEQGPGPATADDLMVRVQA